jgi:hypothetical protein
MGSGTACGDQRGRRQIVVILLRRLNPASIRPSHIVGRRGELLVEVLRDNSRRFEMNPMLMIYFSVGTSFAGVALLKLQARLERWAYQRHAED